MGIKKQPNNSENTGCLIFDYDDANKGDRINWKPGGPRLGVVDLGHNKGMEHRKSMRYINMVG